jgi:NifU-like protein
MEPEDGGDGLLCFCMKVREEKIEQAIRALNLKTVDDVMEYTEAGSGCHGCWPDIEDVLARCARGEFKYGLTAPQTKAIKDAAARRRGFQEDE